MDILACGLKIVHVVYLFVSDYIFRYYFHSLILACDTYILVRT